MKKTRGEGDNNDKSVAAVPHWTRERSDWKQKESSPLSRYVTLYTVLVRTFLGRSLITLTLTYYY